MTESTRDVVERLTHRQDVQDALRVAWDEVRKWGTETNTPRPALEAEHAALRIFARALLLWAAEVCMQCDGNESAEYIRGRLSCASDLLNVAGELK